MADEKAKAGGFSLVEVVRAARREVSLWPSWKRGELGMTLDRASDACRDLRAVLDGLGQRKAAELVVSKDVFRALDAASEPYARKGNPDAFTTRVICLHGVMIRPEA